MRLDGYAVRMRDERYSQDGFWDAVDVDEVIINVDVGKML